MLSSTTTTAAAAAATTTAVTATAPSWGAGEAQGKARAKPTLHKRGSLQSATSPGEWRGKGGREGWGAQGSLVGRMEKVGEDGEGGPE